MTLEERLRINALAFKADGTAGMKVDCSNLNGGAAVITISNHDYKTEANFFLYPFMTGRNKEYQACETYLEEIIRKGETNGGTKEDQGRQAAKADV